MELGLLVTAFGLGLRHGIDWDHIAAIADLSGSAENRRRGFVLSMLYAVGHGAVVFALGVAAIVLGLAIPEGLDTWMGRIVGVTLIGLGVWILFEVVRKGRSFRLRSRWMLIIDGAFAGLRRVRNLRSRPVIEVDHVHEHEHDAPTGRHEAAPEHQTAAAHEHLHASQQVPDPEPALFEQRNAPSLLRAASGHSHAHTHRHELTQPSTPTADYGGRTAAGIGMLHGIGIESPTQIAIFVASTSVAGVGFGLLLLGGWVVGLIAANAILALLAGSGLLNAERSFPIYATLAVIVSVFSIGLGILYLTGIDFAF